MSHIDGYRLFGTKPSTDELYDLGWMQIDRQNLGDEVKRAKAVDALARFASRTHFLDGEKATDLTYVWGHSHDTVTSETTYFNVPQAVNHDEALEGQEAPPHENISIFLQDVVKLLPVS